MKAFVHDRWTSLATAEDGRGLLSIVIGAGVLLVVSFTVLGAVIATPIFGLLFGVLAIGSVGLVAVML